MQYNIGGGEGVKGHRRAHTHNNIIYNILLEFDLRQRRCEYKKTMQSVTGHVYTAGYRYVIIIITIIIWSSSFYVYNRLDDFRNDDSRPLTQPSHSSIPMSTAVIERQALQAEPKRSFTTTSAFIGFFFRLNDVYYERSPRQGIYYSVVYCRIQCDYNNNKPVCPSV